MIPAPATQPQPDPNQKLGSRAVSAFLLWKLAGLRLFLYCFTADFAYYTAAMHGSSWHQLSGEDCWILIGGVMSLNATLLIAFLDKTIQNLERGKLTPPDMNGGGGTTSWTRSTVTAKEESGGGPAPSPAPAALAPPAAQPPAAAAGPATSPLTPGGPAV